MRRRKTSKSLVSDSAQLISPCNLYAVTSSAFAGEAALQKSVLHVICALVALSLVKFFARVIKMSAETVRRTIPALPYIYTSVYQQRDVYMTVFML